MNRKALLLLFVVLALFASSIFATESRMAALGNPFGFIRDNTDISAYPGVINQYERNLRAELGMSGSSWKLGANLPFMNNVLGVYLNTDTDVNVDMYFQNGMNHYNTGDLNISKKIQFYYGFMEKFGVGFGMAIDSKVEDFADNPDKQAEMGATYFEISGGMSDEKLDVGAAIAIFGAGNTNDFDVVENSMGGFGFSANGRYFVMESDYFDLVGAANLMIHTGSNEYKASAATTSTTDMSGINFDLGVGMNYKFDENNKLIFGFKPLRIKTESWTESVTNVTGEDKGGEAWMYIPTYTIGLESQIKPWLTGRIGATQNYAFHAESYDPDGVNVDEDADYQSNFTADMGLAFEIGNFTIDTVLSRTLLHDGPNFIGGKSNGLASMVSINYNY
ncbi:MAG: hypothetical protein CVU50_02350 [Candidatus Cloacimonetes bacterium HGW-Cloacimonetes-3]|jgi:hypothetical protein|nr:MAG: hypothetical protein CVU50_02350 [Candidatus Cloacimonetes bacterium HGW-Cloacimonetes-3]